EHPGEDGGDSGAEDAGAQDDGGAPDASVLVPCDLGPCAPGERCELGLCVKDCGPSGVRCGNPQVCCPSGDICYLGACTQPGQSCSSPAADGGVSHCAPVSTCPAGQYCEASLGRCLPRAATVACEFRPPAGQFSPVVKWEWQSSPVLPAHNQIMMTPVVADLDGDCMPDVVFATFSGGAYSTNGVVRAVRGDGTGELWNVSDPTLRVNPGAQLALADVDSDGHLEIFACHESGALLALHFDGTKKWQSTDIPCGYYDAPQVVDLDHDQVPEVVVNFNVYNARTGAPKGTPPSVGTGLYTTAAELDGVIANGLEIVGGGAVYHHDGTLYWNNSGGTVGYAAVADLDADGLPEVVSVVSSTHLITAYQHDGAVLWGPKDVNNGVPTPSGPSGGGPPTIADFDGDGKPDVATAGGYGYLVLNGQTGAVLWHSTATTDTSSRRTGSSVFDFEGDGRAEAVYNDEHNLRVYDGVTGAVLLKLCSTSGTLWENPVIVDVDADDHAEIVVMSNNYAFATCDADVGGGPAHTGFKVIGDAQQRWVRTRRIWNQHSYHVSNVNDDGTVPATEAQNWTQPGLNNFRQNVQTTNVLAAPDLLPKDLRMSAARCESNELVLSALVVNQGAATAPAGVRVTFYYRDGAGVAQVLKTVQTAGPILAGASEVVSTVWAPGGNAAGPYTVWVVVDDDGTGQGVVNECDEANNRADPIVIGCPQIG
ncbi:MAG: FG-GAP-like repeat-containing protein, partial [Myxococcaceae bacterium]